MEEEIGVMLDVWQHALIRLMVPVMPMHRFVQALS